MPSDGGRAECPSFFLCYRRPKTRQVAAAPPATSIDACVNKSKAFWHRGTGSGLQLQVSQGTGSNLRAHRHLRPDEASPTDKHQISVASGRWQSNNSSGLAGTYAKSCSTNCSTDSSHKSPKMAAKNGESKAIVLSPKSLKIFGRLRGHGRALSPGLYA